MLEIITPAESTRLISIEAARAAIGLADGDASQDAALEALIDQASAAIVCFIGQPLARQTYRETLWSRAASDSLMLSRFPVASIVSVGIGGAAIDADGYRVDLATGIVHRRSPTRCGPFWPAGETVTVYAAGYELPDGLPADIQRAAILMLRQSHMAGGRDPLLRSEETNGVASFSYFAAGAAAVPLEAQALLSPYQIPAVA
ncbi:hypothetical protein [Bosea rubneri]|uniref:Phage gp6-like head-tail connector protein n=1 Tax=Bosea rubneri TaxID=3075434 RepID=A0ABU3S460_9HYPH|nr:hypothetical protein [Bosea sp. ZW T0_25]MDU0339575.1 hypothetical protein [Bosea sp. ZW T0_25]